MATFSTFDLGPPAAKDKPSSLSNHAKGGVPETVVSEGIASKRNILRKGEVERRQPKEKFKGLAVDDGSTDGAMALEKGDPLYDAQDDENYILVSGSEEALSRSPGRSNYDPERRRVVVGPMLTLSEFKRRVTASLEEYFDSEDCAEAIRAVAELACPDYHYEVVKRAISRALDRGDRERELVSRFLSASYPQLLPVEQLGKGFERLFEYVDDLELDVPGASQIVAQFLSRALVDEILPPSFLTDPVVAGLGGEVVAAAKRMLSRDHTHSRVERIWGPGDGRPVDELKQEMDALLAEYLVSHDATEALRCVQGLACGFFLHELVKRAVVLALDAPDAAAALDAVAHLLEHLAAAEVLAKAQLEQGFAKLKAKLPDLVLDAPDAPGALAALVARAKAKGLVNASFSVD